MKFKMFLMSAVLMCVSMVGGCDLLDDSTDGNVVRLETQVGSMMAMVDEQQALLNDHIQRLLAAEMIDAETAGKIAKISEEVDRVQPAIVDITAAIADVNDTGDNFADLLAKLQAANRASAPYNPYAVPIEAGFGLVTVLAGLFGWTKSKEAKVASAKYSAHKIGVESVTKRTVAEDGNTGAKIAADLYDAIGKARANLGVK